MGHIQIDYRICCAMWNFTMKPCIPDGKDSASIAKTIRKKCKKTRNKLESLLKTCFTSKSPKVMIQTIDDFPVITLAQLKKRIILGSFKLRLCRSYIGQVLDHGIAYFLGDEQINKYAKSRKVKQDLKYSKLLSVLITSRHKRSKKCPTNTNQDDPEDPKDYNTKYKVFIQYIPVNAVETAKDNNILRKNPRPYHLVKSKTKLIFYFNLSHTYLKLFNLKGIFAVVFRDIKKLDVVYMLQQLYGI